MKKYFLYAGFVFSILLLSSSTLSRSVNAQVANFISNPSFETAGTTGVPLNWAKVFWGNVIPTFNYPVVGRVGTEKAVLITLSKNTSGDARWAHDPVSVEAGAIYTFSNWYKSNAATEIDVAYTKPNGTISYSGVADLPSSGDIWKQVTATFTIPAGVTKAVVFHLISKKGTLAVDEFSLSKSGGVVVPPPVPIPALPTLTFSASPTSIIAGQQSSLIWQSTNTTSCAALGAWSGSRSLSGNQVITPVATATYTLSCTGAGGGISKQVIVAVTPLPPPPVTGGGEGMVTLSFDDSWISQYTVALPMLQAAGIKATFYLTTEPIQQGWDDFMTPAQVKDIVQKGHEVGGHTITHPHLTQLTQSKVNAELVDSRTYLEALIGGVVTAFAYPYGEFNNAVRNAVQAAGYNTARGVEEDNLNSATTDRYNLQSSCILNSTSLSTIQKAIDDAKKNKQWYILCLHEIKTGGDEYAITPTRLSEIINYIKSVGIKTVTIKEGTALLFNP